MSAALEPQPSAALREALVPVEDCLMRQCDHDYTQDCLDDFLAALGGVTSAEEEGAPVERGVSQTTRLSSAPSLPELALALHKERIDRWGSCGDSSEAYDDHMTFHQTRAERITAFLEAVPASRQTAEIDVPHRQADELGHVTDRRAFHEAVCQRCGLLLAYLVRDQVECARLLREGSVADGQEGGG